MNIRLDIAKFPTVVLTVRLRLELAIGLAAYVASPVPAPILADIGQPTARGRGTVQVESPGTPKVTETCLFARTTPYANP